MCLAQAGSVLIRSGEFAVGYRHNHRMAGSSLVCCGHDTQLTTYRLTEKCYSHCGGCIKWEKDLYEECMRKGAAKSASGQDVGYKQGS